MIRDPTKTLKSLIDSLVYLNTKWKVFILYVKTQEL